MKSQEAVIRDYFDRTDQRVEVLVGMVEEHEIRLERVENRLDTLEGRDAS